MGHDDSVPEESTNAIFVMQPSTKRGKTRPIEIEWQKDEWYEPASPDLARIRVSPARYEGMRKLVNHYNHFVLHRSICEQLKEVSFSNWEHTELELLLYIVAMFEDLNFLSTFNIEKITLKNFLLNVYRNYNRNPFHNFNHCFMVTQMMYVLIKKNSLEKIFSDVELLCVMVASICHDLDHPGLSNYYHKQRNTILNKLSGGNSPLESHHAMVAERLLNTEGCQILQGVKPLENREKAMRSIKRLIMDTDMSKHFRIMEEVKELGLNFNGSLEHNRELLQSLLIKMADLSNELRPLACGDRWIDCLYEEFFAEARLEIKLGIEPLVHMDPRKVQKSTSQVSFLTSFPKAMTSLISPLLPEMTQIYAGTITDQIEFFSGELRSAYDHEMLAVYLMEEKEGTGHPCDRPACQIYDALYHE